MPVVLQTDRAWPDDTVEREVLERAGLELVAGPAEPADASVIEQLVGLHHPDAIMTCWAPVSATAIAASPGLRVVARMGVGLDNIAVAAATERGVLVTNVPDYCVAEVSDHAVGMVLSWTRGLHIADRAVRSGRWDPAGARLRRLGALTVGIVGYGRIGQATAHKLAAFGCRILAHDPHPPADPGPAEPVSLHDLLGRSDVVILHAPLTPQTQGMIGEGQLRRMRPGGLLVNVSRGGLVDTSAVVAALASGHLDGAALDVLDTEPAVPAALLAQDGALVTPHIAFSSDASLVELRRGAAEEVARVFRGEPPLHARNSPAEKGTPVKIATVHGRQVLDSRGRPTVEVDVTLTDGTLGRASVPSGASTGSHEAHELRDGDPADYAGLGVHRAVDAVRGEIAAALLGHDVTDQRGIDARLRELDGTPSLARLGANAVLGTSLAACRASATALGQPLYRRIADLAGVDEPLLPMPMVNILSGGLHAGRGMDVQDFLVVPAAATGIAEALHVVERIRTAGTAVLADRGLPTLLADEGGLSPGCGSGREALALLVEIIERAGLEPGRDALIAIDVAAHSLFDGSRYQLAREGVHRSTAEMIEMIAGWVDEFPIVSIEDALDEDDWGGWTALTARVGDRIRLIGDDLFTTNAERIRRGIASGAANGVLVKVNQNGTLSGTLDVIALCREAGYSPVVSARSGETEDSFLADLAVGTGAGQIKIGSLRCSDRLSKYNQLLRIAEDPSLGFAPSPAGLTGALA